MANAETPAVAEQGKKLLSVEGGGEVLGKAAISALVGLVAGSVLAIAIPALPAVAALAATVGISVLAVYGAWKKITGLRQELKDNAAKPPELQDTRAYIYAKHIGQIVGALAGGGIGYAGVSAIMPDVSAGVTAALNNAEQGVTQAANAAGAAVLTAGSKVIGAEAAVAKISNILPNASAEPSQIIQASVSSDGSGTQLASADDAGPGSEDSEPRMSEGERQAITEAREALPEHAKYVDGRGNFDTRACAKDLYASGDYTAPQAVTRANQMETEWIEMFNEKASKIA